MSYKRGIEVKKAATKPPLTLQTTTLWEYPSQHYGKAMQGDKNYIGATPSYVIWNLLERYTKPGDKVVDRAVAAQPWMSVTIWNAMGLDLISRPTGLILWQRTQGNYP